MKPLPLVFIDQIFSFMSSLELTTYEIEMEKPLMLQLQNGVQGRSMTVFWAVDGGDGRPGTIIFDNNGMTLIFVEKKSEDYE